MNSLSRRERDGVRDVCLEGFYSLRFADISRSYFAALSELAFRLER